MKSEQQQQAKTHTHTHCNVNYYVRIEDAFQPIGRIAAVPWHRGAKRFDSPNGAELLLQNSWPEHGRFLA